MINSYVGYSAFHRRLHEQDNTNKIFFYLYSIFGLCMMKGAFEFVLVTLFHYWDFSAVPLALTTTEFIHKTMQTVLVAG